MLTLQLVRQKGKDMYILFTRWGRIGDRGQFQHTPFASMEEAEKEFRKVYREKSGNHWADRNGYVMCCMNLLSLVDTEPLFLRCTGDLKSWSKESAFLPANTCSIIFHWDHLQYMSVA